MKSVIIFFLIITAVICRAGNDITFEAAAGIPNDDGYEFAIKGTYRLNSFIDLSIAGGLIRDVNIPGDHRICYMPPIDGEGEFEPRTYTAYYTAPTIKLKSKIIRLELGGLLYNEDPDTYNYGYPFTRDNYIQPAFGIELGEPNFYFFGRSLVSTPLFSSGGPFELGIGRRSARGYEHKVFYFLLEGRHGPYISLGYRGEIRLFKNNALIIGATFYSVIAGVKITM